MCERRHYVANICAKVFGSRVNIRRPNVDFVYSVWHAYRYIHRLRSYRHIKSYIGNHTLVSRLNRTRTTYHGKILLAEKHGIYRLVAAITASSISVIVFIYFAFILYHLAYFLK